MNDYLQQNNGAQETGQVLRRHKHDGIETEKLTEKALDLSDVTTNDVSTSKHGFVPKLPNDATKFLNGTGAFSTPATGWAQLTRKVGDGSASSLTTDAFTAKRYLQIYVRDAGGTSTNLAIKFNGDGGNNYYWKVSRDAAVPNNGNNAYFDLGGNQNNKEKYYTLTVSNISSLPKSITGLGIEFVSSSSADTLIQNGGIWQNILAQITTVTLLDSNGSNLPANSEIVVFGSD